MTMKYQPFIKRLTTNGLLGFHMLFNRALKESEAIRNGTDEAAKAMLKGCVALVTLFLVLA